jgi:arginyl-tRNA synthetase
MRVAEKFKEIILKALREKFGAAVDASGLKIEAPPPGQPGHYGSNACFLASKILKKPPFEIAQALAPAIKADPDAGEVFVIKPGYLNWDLKDQCYKKEMQEINGAGEYFGNDSGAGKKVNIEFVSANPTGPLNVVSGRAAAYGDTLANLLSCCGYKVVKEYYVNDHGRQMGLFAQSLEERYLELHGIKAAEIPEGGYEGSYVTDIAGQIDTDRGNSAYDEISQARELGQHADVRDYFKTYGLEYIKNWQSTTLKNFGVVFDTWFSEETLYAGGAGKNSVDLALEKIKKHLFEAEGATWFRTTDFGDDKDRVVKKSDGEYSYLAGDIAYMENKIKRGFTLLINILGPDHHGYIKRLEAIVRALGYEKERLDVLILQQVNLLESGEKVKMSKREGKIVVLDELLDSVGADAARYYFIMRNYNSHLDFDMALAKEKSEKNPVYYVQYAYARVCNIFAHATEKHLFIEDYDADREIDFTGLEPEEVKLMRGMMDMPAVIREAAEKRAPSALAQSIYGLVSDFHSFYNKCRVVTDDRKMSLRRLYMMEALKKTLAKCFKIIGINAREHM